MIFGGFSIYFAKQTCSSRYRVKQLIRIKKYAGLDISGIQFGFAPGPGSSIY